MRVRTHQVVYEKSLKYVSSKPNQSVLYFYIERIVTTLSTVYISVLKQTTMIRIIKLDYSSAIMVLWSRIERNLVIKAYLFSD